MPDIMLGIKTAGVNKMEELSRPCRVYILVGKTDIKYASICLIKCQVTVSIIKGNKAE